MATFLSFTDSYPTTSEATAPRNEVVDGLNDDDFALLLRSIELVVQAGTLTSVLLGHALHIPASRADRMIDAMQSIGVISPPGFDKRRSVIAEMDALPLILVRLMTNRGHVDSDFALLPAEMSA